MRLSLTQLVLRYAAFAVLATLANLGAQRAVLAGGGGFVVALAAGTAAGLVLKFLLDKRWIFYDPTGAAVEETRKFSLYTVTGIGTTLIFWGSETGFWLIGQSQGWREFGAVLGLTVGYVIKFNLDRRFVFAPGRELRR